MPTALPHALSGRTVGSNGPASARPIRNNGLLIALKAVDPHAAPARSEASASQLTAAADPSRYINVAGQASNANAAGTC